MDSPDDFLSNVATYSGPTDLLRQISYDADFEPYPYSTPFPPLFPATTPTTPSLESTPPAETHKGVKKRIRRKPPKLEYCTKAQISRRREQNRKSQRTYRERKETQLQDLQDRVDVVELENERLQTALESLRGDVAMLRTVMARGDARLGDSGSSFGVSLEHATSADYSPYPVMYSGDENQPYVWGASS